MGYFSKDVGVSTYVMRLSKRMQKKSCALSQSPKKRSVELTGHRVTQKTVWNLICSIQPETHLQKSDWNCISNHLQIRLHVLLLSKLSKTHLDKTWIYKTWFLQAAWTWI